MKKCFSPRKYLNIHCQVCLVQTALFNQWQFSSPTLCNWWPAINPMWAKWIHLSSWKSIICTLQNLYINNFNNLKLIKLWKKTIVIFPLAHTLKTTSLSPIFMEFETYVSKSIKTNEVKNKINENALQDKKKYNFSFCKCSHSVSTNIRLRIGFETSNLTKMTNIWRILSRMSKKPTPTPLKHDAKSVKKIQGFYRCKLL